MSIVFCLLLCLATPATLYAQGLRIVDTYPDKARYAPGETASIIVELAGVPAEGDTLFGSLLSDELEVGHCASLVLPKDHKSQATLACTAPAEDFRGYLVDVSLRSANGTQLAARTTAVDISSDWKRFPRYGYLAHYNLAEGASTTWIAEMNKFHLNGIQFYDFQYRHEQPLAGSVSSPATSWPDIARREVDKNIVDAFIEGAHRYNMVAMAYNASYSSYEDVFLRSRDPLPLSWGTWSSENEPRSPGSVKSTPLPSDWSTTKLFYMNQNDAGWQHYLFSRMNDLFAVYKFDGWQIDTFGERSAYSFNGTPVNFITGMPAFIEHARNATKKRVVMNAVNAQGQSSVAGTPADFVYSELWDNHETFSSMQKLADEIHTINPSKAYVIAAYVNRKSQGQSDPHLHAVFNIPDVLLTDASIFALGASHIELGDGNRLLSSEYFPADTRLSVPDQLKAVLRNYYDFLTAYENDLRDAVRPADMKVAVEGFTCNASASPGTIWSIRRLQGKNIVLHLINLLGTKDGKWRDPSQTRTVPPELNSVRVSIEVGNGSYAAGWASPETDDGRFHALDITTKSIGNTTVLSFSLPSLKYWDMIVLKPR